MKQDVEKEQDMTSGAAAINQAAQKKQVIELSQVETTTPTQFVGYDKLESAASVLEVVGVKDRTAVILDSSPLYAEMGGQVGDAGEMSGGGEIWTIANTQKAGDAWLHFLADKDAPAAGTEVQLAVNRPRREAIQRHHTVTHLLHWALHEVVNRDATQKGSYVGPEKLTFDFSSAPLTPQQVADVERLVNERILENAAVTWTEVGYADVKARHDIMQFFGDKYGDRVRVVQVGGKAASLDGYSMELCGGTHTRATGEIGLFRIGWMARCGISIAELGDYCLIDAASFSTDTKFRKRFSASARHGWMQQLSVSLRGALPHEASVPLNLSVLRNVPREVC